MRTVRRRVWELVSVARPGDGASRAVDVVIVALILLSVGSLVLGTIEEVAERAGVVIVAIEFATIGVFAVEYVARIWSCVEEPGYERPVSGRVRYALKPLSVTDFLAVAPFFIAALGLDLRALRLFRIAWIARVLKLGRYSSAMQTLGRVLSKTRSDLTIVFGMLVMLMLVASSLMYYAEREAQPEVFGSIPDAMWWAVVTLTTVGYGDAYPVTWMGKLIAACVAVIGVGFVTVPAGVISAGYLDELRVRREAPGEVGSEG